ncbi:hypothetical protein FRB91_009979 [Serendipita sp. 411]|nr:hypothetical protein FRC15_000223 [Serendipita sp. 397]KAG8811676.1 hypothetical protein FRC19_003662 [Serendipita sp. 401]KAG8849394.1 hypothetical protein FRB91_009979 [Serendipita sp. 411]KAG9033221.1 hypothetical protein FS842_003977 [Serendipita sp. 407]
MYLIEYVFTVVPLALGVSAALQAPVNNATNIQTLAVGCRLSLLAKLPDSESFLKPTSLRVYKP